MICMLGFVWDLEKIEFVCNLWNYVWFCNLGCYTGRIDGYQSHFVNFIVKLEILEKNDFFSELITIKWY
jgi:hypothetical protein